MQKSSKLQAAKQQVQAKRRTYAYQTLDKCDVGGAPQNFYAVILDSTFPHKSYKSNKYLTTLKIADTSSKFSEDGTVDYISVVFFADNFDDLPVCQRVGDIIRIHRATVGQYKDRKQITVNICFNSSWAIFTPQLNIRTSGDSDQHEESKTQKVSIAQEFQPAIFFGKSIQVERHEHKLIRGLRKWSATNFSSKPVLSNKFITRLSDIPRVGAEKDGKFYDFDLQVKVIQLFKVDAYQSEMRVIDDSGEIWHSQVYNLKYRWLREGQYIRIRAATLAQHSTGYVRTFGMRPYSNILSLPYPCALAQNMLFDEKSEKQAFEGSQLTKNGMLQHPIVVTTIEDNKLAWSPITPLANLLKEESKEQEKDVHRVRFSVAGVSQESQTPSKCVKVYDTKSNAIREISPKKESLGKNEKYVLCLTLFVKDFSNMLTNQFLVVNVIDKDETFFKDIGSKPADFVTGTKASKTKAAEKLTAVLDTLTKFNVWVEAGVARQNDHFVVTDSTHLKVF